MNSVILEAVNSSESLILTHQTTECHYPEDNDTSNFYTKNIRSQIFLEVFYCHFLCKLYTIH